MLGWPHPDHLLEVLTPAQFASWKAYYRVEPWGYHLTNVLHGMQCFLIATGAGAKDVKHTTFMLDFEPKSEDDDEEANEAASEAAFDRALAGYAGLVSVPAGRGPQ